MVRFSTHISLKWLAFPCLLISAGYLALLAFSSQDEQDTISRKVREATPRCLRHGSVTNWWDSVPPEVLENSLELTQQSNIYRSDYAGPESCKLCHEQNFADWSNHSHRWMNALATEETVKGDFSGTAEISYLGGRASFYRDGDHYRMELQRGTIRRVYEVTQTIGSRFYQYYVGKGLEGPEPDGHDHYKVDHVLPFGYWLDEKEWVPVVHIHGVPSGEKFFDEDERPDGRRSDPFDSPGKNFPHAWYYRCNNCHTTFSFGDLMLRNPRVLGRSPPAMLNFSVPDYLSKAHPQLWDSRRDPTKLTDQDLDDLMNEVWKLEAPEHAVTLGISCEACHLGAKQHIEREETLPQFFPTGQHLFVEAKKSGLNLGRTQVNVNWVCGRCHAGNRPQFAAGMATWNSTEYSDAMKGSCYSQLKCTDCHNPHKTIGKKWTLSPQENDALCIKCHQQFDQAEAVRKHTHHAPESKGSRCMNCHMPRINEGMQDVVRTHTIFSPTEKSMIEANQINACNQCHTEQPIDWTVRHLRDWYQADYSDYHLTRNYIRRDQATALGWLKSSNKAVRLVAADSLTRTNSHWALPELIGALDDPYLLNRQFAQIGLERMLNRRLSDFGYLYYMTPDERKQPLSRLRAALLPKQAVTPFRIPK